MKPRFWRNFLKKNKKSDFFLNISNEVQKHIFKGTKRIEKKSKKIKIFKFVKKFRTTFFFQRFFRYFFKKSDFLKNYSIFFPSCFSAP